MVDPKHNRIRRKTASNEVSSENRKAREGVGSKKDDEDFGPGKRREVVCKIITIVPMD